MRVDPSAASWFLRRAQRSHWWRRRGFRNVLFGAIGLIVASTILGCGSGSGAAPEKPFLPSTQEARAALESVLTAWRDSPQPLPDPYGNKTVRFVDKQRLPNQRLRDFEVVGARSEENARQFTVRMTLEPSDGDATELVRYNVFGRNPIWVFRLEDYELISHWEHEMKDAPRRGAERPER